MGAGWVTVSSPPASAGCRACCLARCDARRSRAPPCMQFYMLKRVEPRFLEFRRAATRRLGTHACWLYHRWLPDDAGARLAAADGLMVA